MHEIGSAEDGLTTLLRLARADMQALAQDLSDIARARAAAESALAQIDGAALEAESDELRVRRLNLSATLMTLTNAEENARERLEAAKSEVAKFEKLIPGRVPLETRHTAMM